MAYSSVLEIVFRNAEEQPQAPAVADAAQRLNCGEYRRRIISAAHRLRASGLRRGERALITCTQDVPYLVALHAVQLCGAVAVPLEKNCAPGRAADILAATEAALFITNKSPAAAPFLQGSGVTLTTAADLFAAADEDAEQGNQNDQSDKNDRHAPHDLPLPQAEDSSLILYTTGTTGASKGIELTHGADVAVAENVYYGVAMRRGQREILPMPLNHSFALRRYFATQLAGGVCLLLNGLLGVKQLFRYLEEDSADAMALAPSALTLILRLSGERLADYAQQLDYLQFGSAPLPEEDKQILRRLLPGVRLYNIYGSTEAGCASVLDFSGDDDRPHCIGRPTRNSRFRLLDAEGGESAAGDEGRLAWGGSMLMKGYWREQQLTADTLRGGFVISSDLGRCDEQGRLYMLGRADDVINWGGMKIAPQEVEDAALRCPEVAECACVATRDPLEGDIVTLFYTLSAAVADSGAGGADGGEAAVTERVRHRMAQQLEPYQLPRRFVVLPALPRTYNGKLDRKQLRQM